MFAAKQNRRFLGIVFFVTNVWLAAPCRAELADGTIAGPWGQESANARIKNVGPVVFLNGIGTNSNDAEGAAKQTANKIGHPVTLCYNAMLDMKLPRVVRVKLNRSTQSVASLRKWIIDRLAEPGQVRVNIISHSAGAIIVNVALWDLAEHDDTKALLEKVHVLTVGSAVLPSNNDFADGWPQGLGSCFHVFDETDWVAQTFGPARDIGDGKDGLKHHQYGHYLNHGVDELMLNWTGFRSLYMGRLSIDAVIAASDPKERVVRAWVRNMRRHQESRRAFNFALDWGTRVRWSISDENEKPLADSDHLRFTVMQDVDGGEDFACLEELSSGSFTAGRVGEDPQMLYIGRVFQVEANTGKRLKDKALWKRYPDGFWIIARPDLPGPPQDQVVARVRVTDRRHEEESRRSDNFLLNRKAAVTWRVIGPIPEGVTVRFTVMRDGGWLDTDDALDEHDRLSDGSKTPVHDYSAEERVLYIGRVAGERGGTAIGDDEFWKLFPNGFFVEAIVR